MREPDSVRFAEAPISNLRAKISIIVDEIQPYLDVPYVTIAISIVLHSSTDVPIAAW